MTSHLPSSDIKSIQADGKIISRGNIAQDPLKLKIRLYIQIGELLRQLESDLDEHITIRERTMALAAIGRLQDTLIDKGREDNDIAGSAVRKYEGAFKNGPRRRTKGRSSAEPEPDSWDDGADTDSAA
jgi:hypothetical protein